MFLSGEEVGNTPTRLQYALQMEPNHRRGLVLHDGPLSIMYGDKARDCHCRVTCDLARKFHVVIDCQESLHDLLGGPMWFQSKEEFKVLLPGSRSPLSCDIFDGVRQQIFGNDPSVYPSLTPLGGSTVIDLGVPLQCVNAAIPNLGVFIHPSGNLRLTDEEWTFEVIPVSEARLLYPAEMQSESYQITHHLLLTRSDGTAFSSTHAREALNNLSTFLSFCAEQRIAPVLVAGIDASGRVAMQEWGTALVDPGKGHSGWLDEYSGGTMAEIFPGFSALMKDSEWSTTIRTAVYWYVRADTSHIGPDGAIILIQTALERLAWHILVRVRRAISEQGFSKLAAADQLRLVLSECSVPLELPSALVHLSAVAKGQKGEPDWLDGPEAFVAVRNQIIHPTKRRRVSGGHAFFETLQLGKWYLELILLKSCAFNGQYACRLNIPRWTGSVEPVPWTRPGSIRP